MNYNKLIKLAKLHSVSFNLENLDNVIITYIPHKDVLLCDALSVNVTLSDYDCDIIRKFCIKMNIKLSNVFCHVTHENHIYLTQLFREGGINNEIQEK